MSDELNISDLIEETKGTGNIGLERKMTIAAIMNTAFMKGIAPLLKDLSLIESVMCRTVLSWALEYWRKYGMAMQETVQSIYEGARGKLNQTTSKDLSDFLQSVSQQYAEGNTHIYNVQLEVDIVEDYMDKQNLTKLQKNIEKAMLTNNLVKAKQHVNNYNQVKQAPNMAIEGGTDFSRYRREKNKENVLFNMRAPFDQLHGPMCRKYLSAIASDSKKGKSWVMVDVAVEALRSGLAVFICSLEMDVDTFLHRVDKALIKESQMGGHGKVPVFKGKGDNTTVSYIDIEKEPHTPEELEAKWKAFQMFTPSAKIFVHEWSQHQCSVEDDLKPQIDYIRESEGIAIDVVICDYADLLKVCKGDERSDNRIKVGNKWKAMKKLAQDYNLFLFTGSQLNRDGILAESASKEQDSNSILKLSQNPQEKRYGIYRESVMFHRHIEYSPSREMLTLSNLGLGQVRLSGRWLTEDMDYMPDIDGEHFYLWRDNTGEEWRDEVADEPDIY